MPYSGEQFKEATLQAPPNSLEFRLNEPGGMTTIFDYFCDDLTTAPASNTKFSSLSFSPNAVTTMVVNDPTGPFSPTSLQCFFGAGTNPGISSGICTKDFSPYGGPFTCVYCAICLKYDPRWYGDKSASVSKNISFTATDTALGTRNYFVSEVNGSGYDPLYANMTCQGTSPYPVGIYTQDQNLGAGGYRLPVYRGAYSTMESVVQLNTTVGATGFFRHWYNGLLMRAELNKQFLTDNTGAWLNAAWAPVYGGAGGVIPVDQYIWVNRIYMSAKA